MIRLVDATILAYTKLKTHKIRTSISVGVAGMLFGLIGAVVMISQGVFTSVNRFSDEGLNNRTILNITRSGGDAGFNEYDHRSDPEFVSAVKVAYVNIVTKKQAAAKKFGIYYNQNYGDPSPLTVDSQSKKEVVSDTMLDSPAVQQVANAERMAMFKPFDITGYISKFHSAKVIQRLAPVRATDGSLNYMQDGQEGIFADTRQRTMSQYGSDSPSLQVLDGSLTKPFISSTTFDPTAGDVPVVIPYSEAEKLLGFKKLDNLATDQQRLDRLSQVRKKVGDIRESFCYRNTASSSLLSRAIAQQNEIDQYSKEVGYVKPDVIYQLPSDDSCGPVLVVSDNRSSQERKQEAAQTAYEKEIGEYAGDPYQQKITVQGVGISSDFDTQPQTWSVSGLVSNLFSSQLGYGGWSIPGDMLAELPEKFRPAAVFDIPTTTLAPNTNSSTYESYLVEFGNPNEAREVLSTNNYEKDKIFSTPFGSGVLFVDEMRRYLVQALLWAFLAAGGVAIIILASLISRTVADGRRESAVFRAIGASRLDISTIYGIYVLMLASRVVVFSAVLASAISIGADLLFSKEATISAKLAYTASDTTKEFHLFSLTSPYLLWIIGVILASSVLSSIIPVLLGARRNPINDMRNDT
ncbi:MAG: ABC transporter permease [Candidatus Saccharimonas sp.]